MISVGVIDLMLMMYDIFHCPFFAGAHTGSGGLCPAGYYCEEGSELPQGCPAGTYQDEDGQSDCKACPTGRQ